MTVKECRKALVALLGTAVSAYVAAWAQTNGVLPGWLTAGACALMGVVVGLVVLGVRNERPPLPESYFQPITTASIAAARAAARLEAQNRSIIARPTGPATSSRTRSTP